MQVIAHLLQELQQSSAKDYAPSFKNEYDIKWRKAFRMIWQLQL